MQVSILLTKIVLTIINNESFLSSPRYHEKILKEIINLDKKKKGGGPFKKLSAHRLNDVSDVCSRTLANIWNEEVLLNNRLP